MKYILLQHYFGELKELEQLSVANMQRYATQCRADYQLVVGQPFNKVFTPPCQKLCMLDEQYDDYDVVVMVDIDMFTANNLQRNIFTEETGIGVFSDRMRTNAWPRLRRRFPSHSSDDYQFYGGAIWRLDRNVRQLFRRQINFNDLQRFSGNLEDEGMMHRLAMLAEYKEKRILDDRWCYDSYGDQPESAYMIHIRKKIYIAQNGQRSPTQDKILNYAVLKKRGIVDE